MTSDNFNTENLTQIVLSGSVIRPNTRSAVPEFFTRRQIRLVICELTGAEDSDGTRLNADAINEIHDTLYRPQVGEGGTITAKREEIVKRYGDPEGYEGNQVFRRPELAKIATKLASGADEKWMRSDGDSGGILGAISA